MSEIKDDTNRWRDIYHVLGLEESILWKWLYYPKQSIDSTQSISNYQWHFFFYRTWTENVRICTETQKTLNSQSNLKKEKNGAEGNQAPWLQTVLEVIKTVW